MQRRQLLCASLAWALAASGCARRQRVVYVEDGEVSEASDGPPATRTEILPPRPDGDVTWIPGRWKLEAGRWVWQTGHYVQRPYRNAIWVPGKWQQRGQGWIWVNGHWI